MLLGLDWIVQCFTSLSTQYRLYGRRFLQVKRPNQQYQSTEGESCKGKQPKKTQRKHKLHIRIHTLKYHTNTAYTNKHSKSPSLQLYGVTRGQLPQRAGLPGLNGGGVAAAVPLLLGVPPLGVYNENTVQESRAVTGNPRDAAVIFDP